VAGAYVVASGNSDAAKAVTASSANSEQSTAKPETLFVDVASADSSSRLNSAREASKRGDYKQAIEDYRESISREPATGEAAATEVVDIFLAKAKEAAEVNRYVDEADQLNQCHKMLHEVVQQDKVTGTMSKSARDKVFKAVETVRTACVAAANRHLDVADGLRKESKGNHWWNDDDESMQRDALHQVNLAWMSYPTYTDEAMINRMYEIHSEMKGELSTWQYNQVMERDRLQSGRAFGDK